MRKKLQKKTKEQLLEISCKSYELLEYIKRTTKLGKIKEFNDYFEEIFK